MAKKKSNKKTSLKRKIPSNNKTFLTISSVIPIAAGFLLLLLVESLKSEAMGGLVVIGMLFLAGPIVGIFALINVIAIPKYMYKNHETGGLGVLFLASWFISAAITVYLTINVYIPIVADVTAPKLTRDERNARNEASAKALNQEQKALEKAQAQAVIDAEVKTTEISIETAKEMLEQCKVQGFFYENQMINKSQGLVGELSATGVVIAMVDEKTTWMSVADRHVDTLLPVARVARDSDICWLDSPLSIFRDNNMEHQQQDGTWKEQ